MIKLILIFVFFISSCSHLESQVSTAPIKKYFNDIQGCFLLYDINKKVFVDVYGDEVCKKQFPACSTFKVPLALMAFDSGVLKDENEILKWNGVKGVRPETNKDHNAKTWMQDSVVWFSQRLTPKIGQKKLQKYLDDFNYGNKDLSGGITEAWLISPAENGSALKISAYEQIDFIKKFWRSELPVSKRSLDLTKSLIYLETSENGFKLSGKTGSNFYDKERKIHLGWFVGHIQNKGQEYLVVTNISDIQPIETSLYGGTRAKAIALQILKDKGLW